MPTPLSTRPKRGKRSDLKSTYKANPLPQNLSPRAPRPLPLRRSSAAQNSECKGAQMGSSQTEGSILCRGFRGKLARSSQASSGLYHRLYMGTWRSQAAASRQRRKPRRIQRRTCVDPCSTRHGRGRASAKSALTRDQYVRRIATSCRHSSARGMGGVRLTFSGVLQAQPMVVGRGGAPTEPATEPLASAGPQEQRRARSRRRRTQIVRGERGGSVRPGSTGSRGGRGLLVAPSVPASRPSFRGG